MEIIILDGTSLSSQYRCFLMVRNWKCYLKKTYKNHIKYNSSSSTREKLTWRNRSHLKGPQIHTWNPERPTYSPNPIYRIGCFSFKDHLVRSAVSELDPSGSAPSFSQRSWRHRSSPWERYPGAIRGGFASLAPAISDDDGQRWPKKPCNSTKTLRKLRVPATFEMAHVELVLECIKRIIEDIKGLKDKGGLKCHCVSCSLDVLQIDRNG